ncbi:MAG TPA: DUF4833 domain-containing protein [Cyclobacteriaceae bacterium]|nr:DUF4833 domain-containing protein [Cyclobacteriaceae bacterium]
MPDKKMLFVVWLSLIAAPGYGQQILDFPVPTGVTNMLFYLQRTPNTNTVIYEINMKDGVLDSVEPVHIFWIRYADKGQREELTEIQRNLAYGLVMKKIRPEEFELRFHAKKEHVFILKKGNDERYHVFVSINNKSAVLEKIFLQINGGPVFSPNIEYVMFYGSDAETGEPVSEQVRL